MSEIKFGDLVMFKAGSPEMLVFEVAPDGSVGVCWFNDVTGEFSSETIRSSFLIKTKDANDE